jgi:hypothetical protein
MSNTPKFKKGDRVRVIQPNDRRHGQVLTVYDYNDGWCIVEEGNIVKFDDRELELVTSDNSELSRLVADANRGYKAADRLQREFGDQVYHRAYDPITRRQYDWKPLANVNRCVNTEIMVAPKPSPKLRLEPEGWDVEIKGDKVSVGCREFIARNLRNDLDALIKGKRTQANSLRLYWAGVIYDYNQDASYYLSRESADKLLKFLEENSQ